MNKIDIKKNRLDLAYQRNLQLLNTLLLIGAGGFITYLAALVLDTTKAFHYTIILVVLSCVTLIIYKKIDARLKSISEEIRKLC